MMQNDQIDKLLAATLKCMPDKNGSYGDISAEDTVNFLAMTSPERIYALLNYTMMIEDVLMQIHAEGEVDVTQMIVQMIADKISGKPNTTLN